MKTPQVRKEEEFHLTRRDIIRNITCRIFDMARAPLADDGCGHIYKTIIRKGWFGRQKKVRQYIYAIIPIRKDEPPYRALDRIEIRYLPSRGELVFLEEVADWVSKTYWVDVTMVAASYVGPPRQGTSFD